MNKLLALILLLFMPTTLPLYATSKDLCLLKKETSAPIQRILFIQPWYVAGGMVTGFYSLLNSFPDQTAQIDVCVLRKAGILFEPFSRKNISLINFSEALTRTYDTVVCYAQWIFPHVWVKKIRAHKRILWIHGDTSSGDWVAHLTKEKTKTNKIDSFVCVSSSAADSFKQKFPELASKACVIYNLVDNQKIKQDALAPQYDMPKTRELLNVVTISRLAPGKGLETAIMAHAALEKEGFHFRWYVVGEGYMRKRLEPLIKEHHLEDKFILLGHRANPYPYIRDADIFALFSKAEGFCLALTEAKILQKPIIVTNFTAAFEQIQSGKNGLIVPDSLEAICQGMKQLLTNQPLRQQFSQALQGFEFNNAPNLKKIEQLFQKGTTKPKK